MNFKLTIYLLFFFFNIAFSQNSADLFNEGFDFYKQKKYDYALIKYKRAIAIDLKNKRPDYLKYYNMGVVLSEIDSFKLAIQYLDTCIYLKENMDEAYGEKGINQMLIGLNELAIDNFTEAINLNPKSISRFNRGLLYFNKKEYNQAKEDLEEYLLIKEELIVYVLLAETCAKLKDIVLAEKYLIKAEQINSKNLDVLEAKIWIEGNKININKNNLCEFIDKLKSSQNYSHKETIKEYSTLCENKKQ